MFDNETVGLEKWNDCTNFFEYSSLDFTIPTYPDKQAVGLSGRKSRFFLLSLHILQLFFLRILDLLPFFPENCIHIKSAPIKTNHFTDEHSSPDSLIVLLSCYFIFSNTNFWNHKPIR